MTKRVYSRANPATSPLTDDGMATLVKWFREALRTVGRYRRAYVLINVVYYGLVTVAMAYVASHPDLQSALIDSVTASFSQGPLADVAQAYGQGHVIQAMALTFGFNFFVGSVLVLLAPSLVIPFAGVFIGLVRATMWGLVLAPTTPELQTVMIPHLLTLILEGQGYILAMLASWMLGRGFTSPSSVGADSWRKGYALGLSNAAHVFLLVAVVLAIAAMYEALEVIYLVPQLLP